MARVCLELSPRARALACSVVGGLALGAAPAGQSADLVAGGSTVQIQQTPWAVYIAPSDPNGLYCDGVIVDSLHIVTAAHCVYTDKGVRLPPSAFTIDAGVSVIQAPLSTDVQQLVHGVASIRVHPGFVWSGTNELDDVAVLTLSSPLDLSGAAVQALALPTANAPYPANAAASLAGFGLQHPGVEAAGTLNRLTATIDPQGTCGPNTAGMIAGAAIVLCAVRRVHRCVRETAEVRL
jgi:secreted trypsin-like serine protease